MMGRIAVLGAGAWGTALAAALAMSGRDAVLWGRDGTVVDAIRSQSANPRHLPGIRLPERLTATTDLDEAIGGAGLILSVVPAQATRQVLTKLADHVRTGVPIVLCAKGIELGTGRPLSDVATDVLPGRHVAVLSGPSFAVDVAKGLPTAVTLACADGAIAQSLAKHLSTRALRLYSSTDVTGVELGGALKNVMAIAVGAARGLALGASAEAALATRGFVELRRMANAAGARPETLMGLSGLGDLMLTCSSAQSRNLSFGMAIGRGESLDGRPLAEGVATARIASRIARDRAIKAPIIEAVAALVDGELTAGDAVTRLLERPVVAEDT